MSEATSFRKGYKIHFIKRDEYETITATKNPSDPLTGEVTTDREQYSVDFLQRWQAFGFIKIHKK